MTSLIILSSITLNGYSQGLEIPEFKPKSPATLETPDFNSDAAATQKAPSEEIAMKAQLEEHENEFLDDYYQVDNFAFVASNNSKLCPSGNCEYELDAGEMQAEYTAGERALTGKFKVDTGESTKIMNMRADWETVEERESPEGEIVKVIEGELGIGRNEFSPENKYQITGTLTPDGDGYILEAKGMK
jgi:hypothetical protein